eukprot:1928889-Prymnesium_polylepis.1
MSVSAFGGWSFALGVQHVEAQKSLVSDPRSLPECNTSEAHARPHARHAVGRIESVGTTDPNYSYSRCLALGVPLCVGESASRPGQRTAQCQSVPKPGALPGLWHAVPPAASTQRLRRAVLQDEVTDLLDERRALLA